MEKQKQFEVKFTDSEYDLSLGEIQLIDPFESWNDFGYQIHCKAKLWNPILERPFLFNCFIGFLPPDNNVNDEVKNAYISLNRRKNKSLTEALCYIQHLESHDAINELRFFTMLPSMADYREAVEELGPELLKTVLEAINDLVYYKDVASDWFDKALESEVYNLGFMRNSEPFYAFHNADNIINGVKDEKFEGISTKLHLEYQLDGFENKHKIQLNYEQNSLIPKRINILIGKNGVGKSQALKSFCRAALRYQDNNTKLFDTISKDRPMINRLLAIGTPGETQNTFPAERRTTQKLYYRRLSLTRSSRSKTTKSINDIIIQLVRSNEKIGDRTRWELFLDTVSKTLPLENLALRTKNDDYIKITSLSSIEGEQRTLEKWAKINRKSEPLMVISNVAHALSSGQLTFIKFAVLCCLYIENGSFVLLDEPETHMHPNMISNFVELLDEILENTGSLALIATHSAYFVREIPQDQVHVFKRLTNSVSISSPRLTTFGSPVDSISRFVFDDDAESKLFEKLYQRISNQNKPFSSVLKDLEKDVSVATIIKLNQRMEEAK